jgi:hypothetical protein
MTPEHCIRELTEDFVTWILGVFDHADHFLVNSISTRDDLLLVARNLGYEVSSSAITVITLDADFRKPASVALPLKKLKKWELSSGEYVLFVSTIESRKNHLGAFAAWLTLIKRHGKSKVPKLVCVGNEGWLNTEVYSKLYESKFLQSRVVMLSKLSDDELALLYDNCLFTLYPSHYEGWGLPVTESLCHGKVPLLSRSSSLPEAGGEFADYFESESQEMMVVGLEKLIFGHEYRLARERKIRDCFRPRSWIEIGLQIQQSVSHLRQLAPVSNNGANNAIRAELGAYYPMKRNREIRIWPGMKTGEMFRAGRNWWSPDDWVTWTKPGGSEIVLRIAGPHRRLRAYFALHGLCDKETTWHLLCTAHGETSIQEGRIAPSEKKWLSSEFAPNDTDTIITIILSGNDTQDLRKLTKGKDSRLTSIGFYGFCVCEADDIQANEKLIKSIALGDPA